MSTPTQTTADNCTKRQQEIRTWAKVRLGGSSLVMVGAILVIIEIILYVSYEAPYPKYIWILLASGILLEVIGWFVIALARYNLVAMGVTQGTWWGAALHENVSVINQTSSYSNDQTMPYPNQGQVQYMYPAPGQNNFNNQNYSNPSGTHMPNQAPPSYNTSVHQVENVEKQ